MTFQQGLIASGYHFQPHTVAFCKEDSNDNLHTYQEQEDNTWCYVKLDVNDMIMTTKVFSL